MSEMAVSPSEAFGESRWGLRAERAILALIWVSVAALVFETVPALNARFGPVFVALERLSITVFTIEYLIRLWRGGVRFATRPLGIIDLLAVLPFYIPAIGFDLRVLRIARTARVFRLFQIAKLARYSVALQTLGRVIVAKRGELVSTAAIMVMLLFGSATLMYYAENAAQPDRFSSIPATLWWAVATLTTVGYGDVVPVTTAGRLVGTLAAALGIGMFALPAGILGAAFLEEFQAAKQPHVCPHCGR